MKVTTLRRSKRIQYQQSYASRRSYSDVTIIREKRDFGPLPPFDPTRRVVVTGMGIVSPLGIGIDHSWKNLIAGQSGIRFIEDLPENIPARIGAKIPRGNGEGEIRDDDSKGGGISTFIRYANIAAQEALKMAHWTSDLAERTGVAVGSGMGSLEDVEKTYDGFSKKGYRSVTPFFIPRILVNLAAGHISIDHGLRGPIHSVATACATGVQSIGDAFNFIRMGVSDVMVCGGSEAAMTPLAFAGFCRAKALTTNYNDPSTAHQGSRPFDKSRSGFVMGEGAGILILEERSHALKRNVPILAEIRGYGISGDAYHVTSPSEQGNGAYGAMSAALKSSGLSPTDIDYVNAHATSTPMGDGIENLAIKRIFGDHAKKLCISSNKGAIGHLLGAAGAVETIFSIQCLKSGIVPSTLNLDETTSEFDLNYVPKVCQERSVNAILKNSFGFGGVNASIVITS
eukprot:TRINITY_DN9922_c0_g1_i1.p1 TRINITY_DN9922_c0_g1~~TRINITY_DN9922_c0_g1_i1.p1  ORF type:complete len:468 (-),score=106.03 TRINITY_DN9922_c0_g1_i1:135-1502(-)